MSSFGWVGTTKTPQTLKNHILKLPQTDLLLRLISSLEKLNKKGKNHLKISFHVCAYLRTIQLIEQMNI